MIATVYYKITSYYAFIWSTERLENLRNKQTHMHTRAHAHTHTHTHTHTHNELLFTTACPMHVKLDNPTYYIHLHTIYKQMSHLSVTSYSK